MVKAVIFDLDDTLISEYEYVRSGFNHVSKILSEKYGLNEKRIYEELLSMYRENSKNVFNRLLEKFNIPYVNEDILSLVKLYREHIPSINFYKDVIPFIDYLKTNNIKTGIITDGYAETQKIKLEKLKAYELVDYIIITDELGKEYWKPHPKSFEMMRDCFNVNFDKMIYVGDNPEKDFYINSVYPIKTVRVIRENSVYINNKYKENIREDLFVKSLCELENVISANDSY